MADTRNILQLGIEAARGGDKAEARELFRLVTREDPNNIQGWLWLAGVADDRAEKRAALERVMQIDPSNELARKGLAALGGATAVPSAAPMDAYQPPEPVAAEPTTPSPALAPSETPAPPAMNVGRATPPASRARVYDQPEQVGAYVPTDFGDEDYDLGEYQAHAPAANDVYARDREPVVVVEDEEPRRRSPLAFLLPLLILLLIGGALLYYLFRPDNQVAGTGTEQAGASASAPATSAAAVGEASGVATASEAASGAAGESPATSREAVVAPAPSESAAASVASESPAASEAAASESPAASEAAASESPAASPPAASEPAASAPAASEPAASAPPSAPAPAPAQPDVASANPAIVPNNQLLDAGTWAYRYTGLTNVATGSYGGSAPSRGSYQIVLIHVRNNGNAAAQIPDGFFVLKDAQGRVYDFNRAASVDYFNRFPGAGDLPADAQIAASPLLSSIPLLFDVAGDASNLVLFSRENTNQGFLIR